MMESLSVDTAERVRRLRDSLGLSQKGLALEAGLGEATVVRIEGGQGARGSTIEALARALKTSQAYLIGETDDPAPRSAAALQAPGEQAATAQGPAGEQATVRPDATQDLAATIAQAVAQAVAQSQAQVADAVTQMAQALASLKSDLADTHRRLDSLTDDCRQGVKSVHDALDELADKVDDLAEVERGVLKQRLDQVEHELYQEGLEGGATKGAA